MEVSDGILNSWQQLTFTSHLLFLVSFLQQIVISRLPFEPALHNPLLS